MDFGLSKILLYQERSFERVGSLLFSSPEILLHGFSHAFPTDIWSAGVVLHIMLSGTFPFLSIPPTPEGILELIVKGNLDVVNGPSF